MPTFTKSPYPIDEANSAEVSLTLHDTNDVGIDPASLSTMVLTLYDLDTGTIINSRDDQDVLGGGTGQNNVTLAAGGVTTWYMQGADNIIVTASSFVERHIALFEWTWDPTDGNGPRDGKKEIELDITNLNRVP